MNLSLHDLDTRIALNHKRLLEPYYRIEQVFSPPEYDWPGDKEGRALLAFCCHAKMGNVIPCMEEMIALLPEKVNAHGYLGKIEEDVIDEQRLSGHSWYLRGLCSYYELTGNETIRSLIDQTVKYLYLPLIDKIESYPLHDRKGTGGVSGNAGEIVNGWRLSSDIGCAFMSIDGLSHAYQILKSHALSDLLRKMISFFDMIDKERLGFQTHCTLTAARGMMRMHLLTGIPVYLSNARRIADLYIHSGMTLTFQNLNWWQRPDSWTEPCAIVDSLILFSQLGQALGGEYKTLARRVCHNALRTLQRDNGGAGCETVTLTGQSTLSIFMDEAPFCCSMRLAEGLLHLFAHRADFEIELPDTFTLDAKSRRMRGDLLYVPLDPSFEAYVEPELILTVGTKHFSPLPLFYRIPLELAKTLKIEVL